MYDMIQEIVSYNELVHEGYAVVCEGLAECIERHLPVAESKVWHGHSVWFLAGNSALGYYDSRY